MNKVTRQLGLAAMLLGLVVGAVGLAQAQSIGRIDVRFTNATNQEVTFFLNGGLGLETRLYPGQHQRYSMDVNQGVQPIVSIYQPNGEKRNFTVANGGHYHFRFRNGIIENSFD